MFTVICSCSPRERVLELEHEAAHELERREAAHDEMDRSTANLKEEKVCAYGGVA